MKQEIIDLSKQWNRGGVLPACSVSILQGHLPRGGEHTEDVFVCQAHTSTYRKAIVQQIVMGQLVRKVISFPALDVVVQRAPTDTAFGKPVVPLGD